MKYLLTIENMIKLPKNIFYLFLILLALSACQSVKDGLTGKKKNNSDEFLVQKKNPLVLPPEFKKLPEPKILSQKEKDDEKEIDIKAILTNQSSSKNTTSTSSSKSNKSLEKSILEKIKNN
tara:strand:- start:7 stop:369 length:363 start_codon:yes stop_codon:yes gene_type:complete